MGKPFVKPTVSEVQRMRQQERAMATHSRSIDQAAQAMTRTIARIDAVFARQEQKYDQTLAELAREERALRDEMPSVADFLWRELKARQARSERTWKIAQTLWQERRTAASATAAVAEALARGVYQGQTGLRLPRRVIEY